MQNSDTLSIKFLGIDFCRMPCRAMKTPAVVETAAQSTVCAFIVRHKHGCSFWAQPQDFTQTAGFKWASICSSLFTHSLKFIKSRERK